MELPSVVYSKAKLALTLTPLLYLVVGDRSHYPASCRLNNQQPLFLDTHPSQEFIVILHKDLSLEEVGIEASAFGENVQYFLSCFYSADMIDLEILFQYMFSIFLFFFRS